MMTQCLEWLSFLQKGGGVKKRCQYCAGPSSPETLQNLRAIQGHSGGKHTDLALQDNVLIYHVGSSLDLHSIIQSGLIPGGKNVKKGRHAVFFTTENPMFVDQHKEVEFDNDEVNNLLGPKRVPSVSTPKTGWRWYDHPSTSSSSFGWQADSWWKSSSGNER